MTSCLSRAQTLRETDSLDSKEAVHLTKVFCSESRRKIKKLFKDLWSNNDVLLYKSARYFLQEKQAWIDNGVRRLAELRKNSILKDNIGKD